MKDNSVNSYNLQDAQQMLDLLLDKKQRTISVNEQQTIAADYVDLASIDYPKSRQPIISAKVESDEEIEISAKSFDSWDSILTWSMATSKSEAGFVVDSQGFVIASRGRMPGQGIEGVGAELVFSIEQLERIDQESGRLSILELEFDRKRLIGFVACSDEKNNFVLGLISPEILQPRVKQEIFRQILSNLPNLD